MKKTLYILMLCCVLSGCKHHRTSTAVQNPTPVRHSGLEPVERLMVSGMKIRIQQNGSDMTLPARLLFIRDSALLVNIMPLGIEMAQLYVTNTEVVVVDKMHRQVATETIEHLQNIELLRPLLQGNATLSVNSIVDVLTGRVSSPPFRLTRDFPPSSASLTAAGQNINIAYLDWTTIGGMTIPQNISITVANQATVVDFMLTKISTAIDPTKLKRPNTGKYTPVSIDKVINF